MPNLKEYAEYNGIDPNKAGEVMLAAMTGGEIPDLRTDLGDDGFLAKKLGVSMSFGIQPDDTREQVLKKIQSILNKLDKRVEEATQEEIENHTTTLLMNSVRPEIEEVLTWLQK